MPKTILLIEDEKNIAELVIYNLEQEGFIIECARDGRSGLEAAKKILPDLVLLDLMLPQLNGLNVCESLRQNSKTKSIPIIMLTAKGTESDKVRGLECGADDYITKPFSPRELIARINAVLRRSRSANPKVLKLHGLELDVTKHELRLNGSPVEITAKEFSLLQAFLSSIGQVLTRESLLEQVWGYKDPSNLETRTVDMHITQLRKKLGRAADRLVTLKGIGYRFDKD